MYNSDLTAEELREIQRNSNKYVRREPCRGYDYEDDCDDDDFLNDYEY